MGKKFVPKYSAYMYQWTHYAEDFNRVLNLRRKGGNNQAGGRFAIVNSQLESSNPKPHWLACGQVKGGEFKLYALCKLRLPSEEEKRVHAEELKMGERAFEKYVYVDEEESFIVALPGEEGLIDLQLDKLIQTEIAKRNGQLQGSNGLEIQIDDYYVERFRKRQIMTIADRIRQLGQESAPGDEQEVSKPFQTIALPDDSMAPDAGESTRPGEEESITGVNDQELAAALDKITREIDDECANLEGKDVDAVAKRRVGQGVFRNLLFKHFDGECCITGLKNTRLLIASHIVPWSKSTPAQKLATENGLLLSVSMDALFDKGLISFSNNGRILIGNDLDPETVEILGLQRNFALQVKWLTDGRKENLSKHRELHGFDASL